MRDEVGDRVASEADPGDDDAPCRQVQPCEPGGLALRQARAMSIHVEMIPKACPKAVPRPVASTDALRLD